MSEKSPGRAQILEAMAHTALALVAAMEREDHAEVSRRLDAWRQERFDLALAPNDDDDVAQDPARLAAMKEHVTVVTSTEPVLRRWLSRPLPPAAELLGTSEGACAYLDRMLPPSWSPSACLVVVVGTGSKHLTADLVRRGHERIIVLLPPDAPSELHPADVTIARDVSEVATAIHMLPGAPIPRWAVLRLPSAEAAWTAEQHEHIGQEIAETVRRRQLSINTVTKLGASWVLQGVRNLPSVARWASLSGTVGRFTGKPCIIVSPGPSLEKNLHLLHDWKGKAVILAVNRCAPALHRAGVVPDALITADPSDLRYHFEGVPLAGVGAVLLGATSHPAMFTLPAPRFMTFPSNGPIEQWLYQKLGGWVDVMSGGSVSCSAFSVATLWDCDPIILIGQDLAFAGEQFYAAGTPDAGMKVDTSAGEKFVTSGLSEGLLRLHGEAAAKQAPAQRIEWVQGQDGRTLATSYSMHVFRRWFEFQARSLAGRKRLLNCTEGGAYIEGMEHLPLAEALARHGGERVEAERIFAEASATLDVPARSRTLHGAVVAMIAALDKCVEHSRRCVRLADKARDEPRAMAKLGEEEKALVASLQAVLFLSIMVQQDIIDAQEQSRRAMTTAANLAASKRLYRAILEVAPQLRPAMVEARDALALQAAG